MKSNKSSRRRPEKLARLPAGTKITKRPLFRPAIPSPFRNEDSPKVVYIKQSTPFMSAVRRVRSLLQQVDKRATQSNLDKPDKNTDRVLSAARRGLEESRNEPVIVKGTGRAIEKVLNLAAWFEERQAEEGVKVRLMTGSAVAIDDIEYDEASFENSEIGNGDEQDLPESRRRNASVLEVRISWR